ncbi:heme-binding protein [Pedobacter sp. Hv1]|uniref:GlcG/HbpS family heme-binding protein n=1 Tax=Pedobacter sp. Hv1 TaxID=1740090 RepID=UPI0006D89A7E|nr:heme-binding protein [Pedobacter sp. Hv1]KQB99837.1 hypothetical protein AQF98_15080 [Pedobacter sp. Hv1]
MNITYPQAIKAIGASIEKAGLLGISASIAVVDSNGYLVAFARLDKDVEMIDFAVKKAKTAMMFDVVDDRLEAIAVRTGIHAQRMLEFKKSALYIAGTAMIKNIEGKVIGVIASSGGSPDQDRDIADSGARILFQLDQGIEQLS